MGKKQSPSSANVAADLFNVKANMDREHWEQTHAPSPPDPSDPRSMHTDTLADAHSDNVSKTTAVVQLSGSLDMLVTPLLLEAWQR